MQSTPQNIPSFKPVWSALRETEQMIKELNETQEETGRLIRKSARLIEKLGRQKHSNTHYVVRQLETMCCL